MKKLNIPTFAELQDYFNKLTIVRKTIYWSKKHSLPGFFSVPVYDVVTFLIKEVQRDDLFTRANSMAFNFFLSLFPSMISLFTLLPYIRKYLLSFLPDKGKNFDATLAEAIYEFVPGQVGEQILLFINDLTKNPRVGLLSFGFLLAVYIASNGMLSMMRGFEKANLSSFKKRTALNKRLIAVYLTFQLGLLLFASIILIITGNLIINTVTQFINIDIFTKWMIFGTRWFIIIFLFYSVISTIYRVGIALKRPIKFFSPGATLATVLCLLTSILFSFYVDNFANYHRFYGGFGTVIVTMVWLQFNSLILLIGFELNASIAVNRDLQEEMEVEKVA